MQPDETEEERRERLAQDNERPFTPAADNDTTVRDTTEPPTDTGVDSTELYQEGVDHRGADDSGVTGYDPEKDQRQQ